MIPVNVPLLGEEEYALVRECLETGWISSEGPFVAQFEKEFAAGVQRQHGIAVANGSGALDIAVAALRLGPGDEVILPTFTIISCAAAIVHAGARPVVVDCDPLTWNMAADQIEARITERTRAIMMVHIYGLPCDVDPILALAQRYSLRVIEDAAEAHGQTYRGRPCGSFGDLSTFSFYPNKLITTGEGGMVVTNDPELADRCRSLRNLCFQAGRRFVHDELGWNYRLTNLQAALGLAQLKRLDQHVHRKREMGALYTSLLQDIDGLQLPLPRTAAAENVYWVYGVVLDDDLPVDGSEIAKRLAAVGIGTRPFFWPMHEQPLFCRKDLFAGEHHPHAERAARRGFYLPSGLGNSESDFHRSAEALKSIIGELRK